MDNFLSLLQEITRLHVTRFDYMLRNTRLKDLWNGTFYVCCTCLKDLQNGALDGPHLANGGRLSQMGTSLIRTWNHCNGCLADIPGSLRTNTNTGVQNLWLWASVKEWVKVEKRHILCF